MVDLHRRALDGPGRAGDAAVLLVARVHVVSVGVLLVREMAERLHVEFLVVCRGLEEIHCRQLTWNIIRELLDARVLAGENRTQLVVGVVVTGHCVVLATEKSGVGCWRRVRQKLPKFSQQVFLVIEEIGDLLEDFRLSDGRPALSGVVLLALLVLVLVQDAQEILILLRLLLEATLKCEGERM